MIKGAQASAESINTEIDGLCSELEKTKAFMQDSLAVLTQRIEYICRTAGKNAAAKSKDVKVGKLTLEHINKFDAEREAAGIKTDAVSPKLLPDYRRQK